MIGARRTTGAAQRLGQFLGRGAGLRIDDAGAGLARDHIGDLATGVGARGNRIADVGAIEPGDDQPVAWNPELFQDVGAGVGIGGRGQRETADIGKRIHQRFEQAVIGAEIMPPFADAMRLVDREQAELRVREQLAEMARGGALGGDVEQVERARPEPFDRLRTVLIDAGQRRRADPHRFGGAELIVHQRDQRRDDDACPLQHRRGQLIAERLARAGRHHRKRPLPREHAIDHLCLHPAEAGEAEDTLQIWEGIGHAGDG